MMMKLDKGDRVLRIYGGTGMYQLSVIDEIPKERLMRKIQERTAVVAVIGLGYVGLPFAVEKGKVGFSVIGIDQNEARVQQINQALSYIPDVSQHELQELVTSGMFSATTDFKLLEEADVIVICVPTPLTKNQSPNLTYVEVVASEISQHMQPGQLISLESTTYPGTTEEIVLPILQASGLTVNQDFFLAHSPERVDPGNKRYTTKNTTKVVGGVGSSSLEVASLFYRQTISNVVQVSSAKVAELVKVYENTFRAVNIALVNELTMLCDRMHLDVWEVLNASYTKPFGIMPFYPGIGVGGHCIPIDPHYLEWKAKEFNFTTRFIALAGEINRHMPEFTKDKITRMLNQLGLSILHAHIFILGVSYKKNMADYRESPSIELMHLLKDAGAHISYHDPHVPEYADHGLIMTSCLLTAEHLQQSDLVIIAIDHDGIDYKFVIEHSRHVLDTKNATQHIHDRSLKVTLL